MDKEELIHRIVKEYPIHQWGCVPVDAFTFDPEVRQICEKNSCGCYASTWTCPPAVGTYEECRAFCLSFETGFVFTGKYELEDSYDFDGMMKARELFQGVCREIRRQWKAETGSCVLLGNGNCNLCTKCTWPDAPCRRPEESIASLEGYGVLVNRLAEAAGINYTNGKDTVTYFAVILY